MAPTAQIFGKIGPNDGGRMTGGPKPALSGGLGRESPDARRYFCIWLKFRAIFCRPCQNRMRWRAAETDSSENSACNVS